MSKFSNESNAVFLNAYLVQRCYGGPEEGGWWYDAGELLESVLVDEDEPEEGKESNLECTRRRLLEKWEHMDDGRDLGSVLSEGQVQIQTSDQPGADWPSHRPHYE